MLSIPMSDAQFASASAHLLAAGVELSGPTGTITRDGITASYTHADGQLTVEVIAKPSFFPLPLVESRLQAYIEQSFRPTPTS